MFYKDTHVLYVDLCTFSRLYCHVYCTIMYIYNVLSPPVSNCHMNILIIYLKIETCFYTSVGTC
jgi:hypothetical protein